MGRLSDGFKTIVTLSNVPTVKIYETDVTPPGADAGGRNDQTSMRNTSLRTAKPKKLKSITAISFAGAIDEESYSVLIGQVGLNQQVTVTLPSTRTIVVYGWVDKFTPTGHKEGDRPIYNFTIEVSNLDGSDNETGPVIS